MRGRVQEGIGGCFLPEQPPSRHPYAGGQETAKFSAGGGELIEDGLAAFGDDGDDLMLALARQIVNGEEEDTESVEAVFAQARDAEVSAEELLVDDDWKAVQVNGNGANGNGHHADAIGPTVELVLGNGHHANGNGVSGNGNGHNDEAPEPQQSLFSWAEFMAEEPVKPKGRSPPPSRCSSGRSRRSRSGRPSRSAWDARPQHGGRTPQFGVLPLHADVWGLFAFPVPTRRGHSFEAELIDSRPGFLVVFS